MSALLRATARATQDIRTATGSLMQRFDPAECRHHIDTPDIHGHQGNAPGSVGERAFTRWIHDADVGAT